MRITPFLALSSTLICGLLAACSRSRGPATNVYLRTYEAISENLASQLRELPKFSPPRRPYRPPPHSTPQEFRGYANAIRNYPNALVQYESAVIERCQALSQLYGHAQNQLATTSAAGVDTMAVELVTLRERTIGQRRELFVEVGRFAQLNRDALVRRRSTDDLDEFVTDIFIEASKGAAAGPDGVVAGGILGAVKGAAGVVSKRETEKNVINDQLNRLAVTATQLQRDVVQYQTEHALLDTKVQAEYSEQDWSFMASKQPVNAKP